MTSQAHTLPAVGGLRLPLSRSRMLMLFVGMNFLFLGADTFLAHWIDRTIKVYEWIPVLHGPIAGLLVLWFVVRPKPTAVEIVLYLLVLASAVMVGLLGTAFHWERAYLASGAVPEGSLGWLIFAPPVAGPLAFAGVALVGLMAALHEKPRDSGRLELWNLATFTSPMTKTQQLVLLVGLGYAGAAVSAILDHARSDFGNPTVWIAIASGVFATAVTLTAAFARRTSRGDQLVYFWTQILMVGVGLLGLGMHLGVDLAGTGELSLERLINHAPVFAPLLYTNLGFLGLIAILRPAAEEPAIH